MNNSLFAPIDSSSTQSSTSKKVNIKASKVLARKNAMLVNSSADTEITFRPKMWEEVIKVFASNWREMTDERFSEVDENMHSVADAMYKRTNFLKEQFTYLKNFVEKIVTDRFTRDFTFED